LSIQEAISMTKQYDSRNRQIGSDDDGAEKSKTSKSTKKPENAPVEDLGGEATPGLTIDGGGGHA
jgi:hypothetical protein